MRSRRSSRDSRPSITTEDGEDSEPSPVEGNEECQFSSARNTQDQGEETKAVDHSPTKALWIPPRDRSRDRDREPLNATPTPTKEKMEDTWNYKSPRLRSAWSCSLPMLGVTLLSAFVLWSTIVSFRGRQCDSIGCIVPRMSPVYIREKDFDTEHTRFASKYSLYLYREHNVDIDYPVSSSFSLGASGLSLTLSVGFMKDLWPILDARSEFAKKNGRLDTYDSRTIDCSWSQVVPSHMLRCSQPKGVPVLFIPGNAGSYKQVRSIAAQAARTFKEAAAKDDMLLKAGQRSLDFFTVDFNEDITAFHGQTMLDQAEYLNEAVAYILSLYHDSRKATMDSDLPDPSSVIILGHSMGGIVARTMLIMPNYQSNSINTIITMSAPHALPPVSFDKQIVQTYDDINNYWRRSFSEKWANNNPLWHVTLVSIAGGGLDTVVPSDYASISSLVPDTHGFTVFTSSIPNVWVGSDHLEISWCDQLMKVVTLSMLDIVDVKRPGQTKPRAERMRLFKKWYLTGMESVAEKTLPQKGSPPSVSAIIWSFADINRTHNPTDP